MASIRKKCPKCGKEITVDKYEYCCPMCGEFFNDMDNDQVMQNHIDLQYNEELNDLKETYRKEKKDANISGLKAWLSGIGCALLLCFNPIGLVIAIGFPMLITIVIICSIVWGPFIPIVNHFIHKRKFNKNKEELDKKYESDRIIQ